jgi:folylpolyglutamate synthase/dihydropteroate synthase
MISIAPWIASSAFATPFSSSIYGAASSCGEPVSSSRVRRLIATQSIHPRAMDPEKLKQLAESMATPAEAVTPIEEALRRAIELAGEEAAVVVAGSLFVAAAARHAWQVELGLPIGV